MRFLRNKFFVRSFCAFLILTFLNSIFFPSISYALTSGQHQPEYTSYEEPGATDMVNLLTGDFTYNMPILNVPVGDESSFNVPLTYHAGIGPEQEASWVGLGWNLNVGAITRSVNGFPDDADGETQVVNVKDLTGVRGWTSSFLGQQLGWDSENGHYGVISLGPASVKYQNGQISAPGAVGLAMGKGSVSAEEVAYAVHSTVLGLVTSIALGPLGHSFKTSLGLTAAGLAIDQISPDYTPSVGAGGYWRYSKRAEKKLFHSNYWITLNQTRTEGMYGLLNLEKTKTNTYTDAANFVKVKNIVNGSNQTVKQFEKSIAGANFGAASDINIDLSIATDYIDNHSPTLLAYDNFHVKGPGVSGTIKPYRLEIGSVAVPRDMSGKHTKLSPIDFVDYGTNKVPFVYEGAMNNRYFHHVGAASSVTAPNFNFGISSSKTTSPTTLNNLLDDVIFSTQRVRSDVSTSKKLPQGNYVEWMSNADIKNTTGKFTNSSYMDYFEGTARQDFRADYNFDDQADYYACKLNSNGTIDFSNGGGLSFEVGDYVDVKLCSLEVFGELFGQYMDDPPYPTMQVTNVSSNQITVNGSFTASPDFCQGSSSQFVKVTRHAKKRSSIIGGFVITAADGMNYHYSIPVYDYNFASRTEDKNDSNKNSTISKQTPFANTWLLTAITGPDFIDRGGVNNSGNGAVDANDWGYWVKFNYGLHTKDFMWRTPYSLTTIDSENKNKIYAEGYKEKYYLNSIETRSHVALFVKDSRKDAYGAPDPKNQNIKRTSLSLKEIALLTREDYKKLTDPAGSYLLKDCSGIIECTYHTGNSDNNSDASDNITGSKLNLIEQYAQRRVIFNYDPAYPLCAGTGVNSDTGFGKLTLKSISIVGRNNAKVFPDYKFAYGFNPTYNKDRWDGWGMYHSNGGSSGTSHKTSPIDIDGSAWSLTSVKSPLGNALEVAYERDDYATISNVIGMPASSGVPSYDQDGSDGSLDGNVTGFEEGQRVLVKRTSTWSCRQCYTGEPCQNWDDISYSSDSQVFGTVQSGSVILDEAFPSLPYPTCEGETTYNNDFAGGTLYIYPLGVRKKGGNIRVKSVTLKDDVAGVQKKTRYIYTGDGNPWTTSSGVVSMEPDYIRDTDYYFYNWLGYPMTPVMYKKVAVLTGNLSNDNDYVTKQVYEFETPNVNMYSMNSTPVVKNKVLFHTNTVDFTTYKDYETQLKYEISRRTGKIGKLNSVTVYDKNNQQIESRSYVYTETPLNETGNNYQGVFSEGTLLYEIVSSGIIRYHKASRTTLLDYPYTLAKVVSTKDTKTSETENKIWDLYTGVVLETRAKSPLGIQIKTVIEPAYKKYPEMGSKAENANYKNMLTQTAASYSYKIDQAGNEAGLLGATAQTWKKEWTNYRKIDGSGNYSNNDDLDLNNSGTTDATELNNKVWRIHENYVWRGDYTRLNTADGTHQFTSSDKFAHSGSNPMWERVGTHERYSHYSNLLESKDMNSIYAGTKYGYNSALPIATAANAKYEEMAFSSAEDRLSSTSPYFGGEVELGNGTIVTTAHTGKQGLSLVSGYGFVFKSSGIIANKKYRASVWATSNNGRIYYKINGGGENVPTPSISQQVVLSSGTWYKIDIEIPVDSGGSSIEVGVKSTSGTIIFDDFRFQPFDAAMSCNVYNPSTRLLEYFLDNDNVFTRYEYNDRGLLVKTYREIIKYSSEKLVSENKDDYRRFHIDQ